MLADERSDVFRPVYQPVYQLGFEKVDTPLHGRHLFMFARQKLNAAQKIPPVYGRHEGMVDRLVDTLNPQKSAENKPLSTVYLLLSLKRKKVNKKKEYARAMDMVDSPATLTPRPAP